MELQNLTPGGFAANCYLLREGNDAVLIDCTVDPRTLKEALEGSVLRAILLTHGHFDHMLTTPAVRAAFSAPILLHEGDANFPTDSQKNAYATFFGSDATYLPPDRLLTGGECLQLGALSIQVIHTPGHTPGGVLYRTGDLLFTGDTIFAHGYGRTDLFGGDGQALRRSLRSLQALPQALHIYPGHGPDRTLQAALASLF